MKVACIGLGQMGGPIADHVIAAGFDVAVVDLNEQAVAARVANGATAAATPAQAAIDADVISITVFSDAQLLEVVSGANGVLQTAKSGAVIAIHTTALVETIRLLSEQAAAKNVGVVDAGISGGESGAKNGTLLLLVGGDPEHVESVQPVLSTFAKEVVYAGPLGTGMALKLARNAIGYAWMLAVHEAMEFAVRAGVDPKLIRHAIEQAAVFDQALVPLNLGGPEPFPADAPGLEMFHHTVNLAQKDLENAIALAQSVGGSVPLLELTQLQFAKAVRLPLAE